MMPEPRSPASPSPTLEEKTSISLERPRRYQVVLLNDDYTPMEFVVMLLQQVFALDVDNATQIMLHIHERGKGVCGVFSLEIAETRANQAVAMARKHGHPLKAEVEQAPDTPE